MTKKIILDCDPGHDDAVAILLALGNPEIELLGVTTVGGNQSLEKVTYNARAVLEKAHATDVAVYAGCDRPIVRPQEVAASIHGESGLDGVELPVPTRPLEQKHAVNYIVETIMASEPGTITLVPTGPLTNIAMAVRMEPRIVERVKEVVLMAAATTWATGAPWPSSTSKSTPKPPASCSTRSGRSPWLASTSRTKRCARPPCKRGSKKLAHRSLHSSRASWTSSARPTKTTKISWIRRCTTPARSLISSIPRA